MDEGELNRLQSAAGAPHSEEGGGQGAGRGTNWPAEGRSQGERQSPNRFYEPYEPLRRSLHRPGYPAHSVYTRGKRREVTGDGIGGDKPVVIAGDLLCAYLKSQDHRMVLTGLHVLRTLAMGVGYDASGVSGSLAVVIDRMPSFVSHALAYWSLRFSEEANEVIAAVLLTMRRVPLLHGPMLDSTFDARYTVLSSIALLVADKSIVARPAVCVQLFRFLCSAPYAVRECDRGAA